MTRARQVFLVPFSAVIWTSSFAWMLLGAGATAALLALGFPYQRVHGWVTAPIFSRVLKIATVRLRVHYHPDFDHQRPSVFAQNHINLLDGHLASAVIPTAFCGIMNAWQFKIPIYGWLMRLSKGIGVNPQRRAGVLAELTEAARERKRIGMSILTFPEAHRTLDGKVHAFHRGVFMMARNAEMPVVPVAVRGFYEVNHKGTWLFEPFRRVDVYVGPQYETQGLDDTQIGSLARELQQVISALVAATSPSEGWPVHQRNTQDAQVNPVPKAVDTTTSPS